VRLYATAVLVALAIAAVAGAGADAGYHTPPPGDYSPTWSPDASAIVFASNREPRTLRVVNPDGTGERPLVLPTTAYAFSPEWRWIALSRERLTVMRPDGSDRHDFGTPVYLAQASWSPDGEHLVFQQQDGIYVARYDGSGLRRLSDGAYPVWSPRGDLIAFTVPPWEPGSVWVMRPDGSDAHVLIPSTEFGGGNLEWSPDGTRLSYYPSRRADYKAQIGVIDVATGASRVYAVPINSAYSWSPRGDKIAIGGNGIGLLDLASGDIRTLTRFGYDPAWSPDGTKLAFTGGGVCRDRNGIYRIDVANAQATRLSNDCTILGTSGPDVLRGTNLADYIVGLSGDDRLIGVTNPYVGDTLEGGPGNDVLTGTYFADTLDGGPGNDELHGGINYDDLRGGPGHDVLMGEGGNDILYARDGARDVVSCGTNKSKTTAPYGEADIAYVDRIDVVRHDCEYAYRPGAALPVKGKTALEIRIKADERKPRSRVRTFTLRCAPAGGTLPHAAAACAKLVKVQNPFAPIPRNVACTMIYGGPQLASVNGVYGGRPVRTSFRRSDGCQIARWNKVRFLFPVKTGLP
jgi:Tol biopolymer transport system component